MTCLVLLLQTANLQLCQTFIVMRFYPNRICVCIDISGVGLISGLAECPLEVPLNPHHCFIHAHVAGWLAFSCATGLLLSFQCIT